jgi:hypothetical protein
MIEKVTPATVIIEPASVESTARAPSGPPVYTHERRSRRAAVSASLT